MRPSAARKRISPLVGLIARRMQRAVVVGEVAPELRAPTEHVEEALADTAAVEHRQASRPRAVEDRGWPVRVADAEHLARDLVERLVPRDPLELPRAAGPRPAQRVAQPVRVVDPLELAEAPHARVQGRHLGRPLSRIGADLDDLSVAHVGVDGASSAAVVAAGAGDDDLARAGRAPRRLVDDPGIHHGLRRRILVRRAQPT
jgi:hypothetical protein